jgi:hypothetical protein
MQSEIASADFGYETLPGLLVFLALENKVVDRLFHLNIVRICVAFGAFVGIDLSYSPKIEIEWYMACSDLHYKTGLVSR